MPYKDYEDRRKNWKDRHLRRYTGINKEKIKSESQKTKTTLSGRITIWKHGSKVRKIEWSLTKEYLQTLPMVCAYTGTPLTLEPNHPNTISLDRIDSSKGYIEENVVFCTANVNYMKRSMTKEVFLSTCKAIVDFHSL